MAWGSHEGRRVRRRRRRLGRRRRRGRGRARAARPRRAAARGGPAPHRGRLHALGGEGDARLLLAAPLRRRSRTATCSRSSPAAASAARRRSTRRSRCAPTSGTSRSGTAHRADQRARSSRSRSPTSSRTTNGSSSVLGVRERQRLAARACTRSSRASGRWVSSSSRCTSYTDGNCMHCGSCLQGCPTNAGKSTQNTYIPTRGRAGCSSCARTPRSSAW